MKAKEVFSIPNLLSFSRIIIIPFFIIRYHYAIAPRDYYLAAGLIVLSGITDCVDGFIARKYQMITDFGKVLDPVADKLTQGAILFTLMLRIKFMSIMMIIFIVKEITMGIISFQLLRQGKKLDGALWFGKVCTAVFYIVMIVIIAFPSLSTWVITSLVMIVLVCLLFSFVMYMKVLLEMKRD